MAENDWGDGLPSGPMAPAPAEKASDEAATTSTGASLADEDAPTEIFDAAPAEKTADDPPPTWTAPNFAGLGAKAPAPAPSAPPGVDPPSAPAGVIPSDAPRAVTLEQPQPPTPVSNDGPATPPGPVRVPQRPYPAITESYSEVSTSRPEEKAPDVHAAPDTATATPATPRLPAPRVNTQVYGTPLKTLTLPAPEGPPLAAAGADASADPAAMAPKQTQEPAKFDRDDDAPTVVNAPLPGMPRTQTESAAAAPAPTPAVLTASGIASIASTPVADPRDLATDDAVDAADTIRNDAWKPAPLPKVEANKEPFQTDVAAALPAATAAPSAVVSESVPAARSPLVTSEGSAEAPSLSAAFFAAPSGSPLNAFDDTDVGTETELAPPLSQRAEGPAVSEPKSKPKGVVPALDRSSPATNAPASSVADLADIASEQTERVDRTNTGFSAPGPDDDDDDFAAAIGRGRRNTGIAAAAVLFLLAGAAAGAFALGVFDPKDETVAVKPRRDVTKDVRRPLYQDESEIAKADEAAAAAAKKAKGDDVNTDTVATTSEPGSTPPPETPPDNVDTKPDPPAAEAAPPTAVASNATESASGNVDHGTPAENGALHGDDEPDPPPAAASEPKRRKRARSRRRSRAAAAKTESKSTSKSTPKTEPKVAAVSKTTAASKAGATMKTRAPRKVRWLTPTGKELGRGNGSISIPAGLKTIVAHDTLRGVKSKMPVKGGTLDYSALPSGTLDIRVFPYADVFVGSEKLGTTPFSPVNVVEGTYRVRLVHEGKTRREVVKVQAGRIARVKVNFSAQ